MKTVLITGSSSGIGKSTAKYFQSKGWNVIATMRSPDKENELGNLSNVLLLKLDVTNEESIKKAISEGIKKFGKIHAVVNNAGYGLVGPFELSKNDQIEKQFKTNVFGLMNVIKEILPHFREQNYGVICNIASIGGRMTFPLYSLYHATKWSVEGFSESLQHELRPFNIKVKIVEPGPIRTDFYGRSADVIHENKIKDYDQYTRRVLANINRNESTGASPEVVAKTIYKAVNSNSWKLRYRPDFLAKAILLLRKILPDGIYNSLIRLIMAG